MINGIHQYSTESLIKELEGRGYESAQKIDNPYKCLPNGDLFVEIDGKSYPYYIDIFGTPPTMFEYVDEIDNHASPEDIETWDQLNSKSLKKLSELHERLAL